MPPPPPSPPSSSWAALLAAPLLLLLGVPFLVAYVALHAAVRVLSLPRFVHRWLLHPATVLEARYHARDAYALVTGASDGLGKALADELAARKWNLLVHGRNPSKLDALVTALKTAHPELDIRSICVDCTQPQELPAILAHNLRDLRGPLTVVINNAGYLHPRRPFPLLSQEEVNTTLATNVVFPTMLAWLVLHAPPSALAADGHHVTESTALLASTNGWGDEAALVPRLGANGAPGLLINVSSMAANIPVPFATTYGPCKAFLTKLSRDLQADLSSATATTAAVEVLNVTLGPTRSSVWPGTTTTSWLVPAAETAACRTLAAVGLGRRDGPAWAGDLLGLGTGGGDGDGVWVFCLHELALGFSKLFPGKVRDALAACVLGLFGWVGEEP